MAEAVVDILITGGAGQIGLELARLDWPANVRLHAPTREALNLCDAEGVRALFEKTPFRAVINAAAYTAVDKAESDVAAAFAANALGPAILSEATRAAGIPLIQVSTDYVFAGSGDREQAETDPVGPLNVYGASKLAGELAVTAGNPRSVILRTAWIVSVHRANFLKTMLELAADRSALRVVHDQTGNPTSARDVADTLAAIALRMIEDPEAPTGVYHFVNAGSTSWAGLAREIFARSVALGGPSATIEGIAAADYQTSARRPANSRLSMTRITRDYGITPRPWQDAVAEIVAELHQETRV